MKYSRVYIESVGYELAPIVVTSTELEARLKPMYDTLHIAPGQLEALTGIRERRWWKPNTPVSVGAIAAAKKALLERNISAADIGADEYGMAAAAAVIRSQTASAQAPSRLAARRRSAEP